MAAWMARLDWRSRLLLLPSQTEGLLEAAGLGAREAEAAAWAIDARGRRHRGAAAIFAALEQLLPGGWPVLAPVYRLPGLRQVADAVYGWVARNRGRLPGQAICALGAPPPVTEGTRRELERRAGGGQDDPDVRQGRR